MNDKHSIGGWGTWLLALAMLAPLAALAQVRVQLVASQAVPGNFLGNQAVYADRDRIYLASYQGNLFVLARDRAAGFPLLQTVQVASAPLTAVRGDGKLLYVTSQDGMLRVYRKDPTPQLAWAANLSETGLAGLALQGREVYMSRGQANIAADVSHVYLNELNEGDIGLQLDGLDLTPDLFYGQTFETGTVVFNRANGKRIGALPVAAGRAIYVDSKLLALTRPADGTGIALYDPETLAPLQTIPWPVPNTVQRAGRWLIAGTEAGTVDVFDLGRNPSPWVSRADLRALTGAGGIEIRGLWADSNDGLIFAASSWSGQAGPSLFVLELATKK